MYSLETFTLIASIAPVMSNLELPHSRADKELGKVSSSWYHQSKNLQT